MMNEGLLSVRNASGRHVSLLNYANEDSKRKYRCCEPGCFKSFTTSGHLARHNRIHTGEKNFPCIFPGCQSRFSRQDNMMQHYRTHMSPKSRRTQKNSPPTEETRPKPRLHAHQRIRSDPVEIEPPLTIDQHLSNYQESLRTIPSRLSSLSKSSQLTSPTLSSSSTQPQEEEKLPSFAAFYQHFPLAYPTYTTDQLPFTLLHPSQPQRNTTRRIQDPERYEQDEVKENQSDDQDENDLLQLAKIVSTFG